MLVAALTVYLVGMFSHRADSPITSESARDGADQVSEGIENGPLGTLPVIIAPLTATAWGEDAASDRNIDFAALVDGEDSTAASAKAGEKVLLTADNGAPFIPEELNIDSASGAGMNYVIYATTEQTADATNVNHLRILTNGTLKDGRTSIEIDGSKEAVTGLVIAFNSENDAAAIIRGISVVGTRMR